MSINQLSHKPRRSVVNSVGDIASDITSLAELQFELLVVDVADSKRQLAIPVTLGAIGVLLGLACFPILLLAFAAVLHEFSGLSIAASLGIAALAGLFLAAIGLVAGWTGLRQAMKFFERSRSEFKRNIEWLKQQKRRDVQSRVS